MQNWKAFPPTVSSTVSRTVSFAVAVAVLLLTSGCGKFFVPETGGGGGTTSGAYLYVANADTATVSGFSVSSTSLNNLANSPYGLVEGISPSALAITPSNSLLYVGSLAGAIYAYSVGSNGSLSIANGGNAAITSVFPLAMKVDTTGKWLIVVDPTPTAYVFAIDTGTGALTLQGQLTISAGVASHIAITPNDGLVYVSLTTGGVAILTFNSSTGVLGSNNQVLKPKQVNNADYGLAVDPAGKFLFVAETGISAVRVLSITATTGALTETTGSPYAAGTGPSGVLVDSTGSYVYVANRTSNNISAYLLSSTGALTPISGSPFSTGTNPVDLAEDNTHTYIAAACSGGSPDLQVFTIGTTTVPGGLTSFKSSTTGTDPTTPVTIVAAN